MFNKIKFTVCFLSLALVTATFVYAQDDDTEKSPQELFTEAAQAQQSGDHEKAIELLKKLNEQVPDRPQIISQLGINYHMAKDYDNAIIYHRKLAEFGDPNSTRNGFYNLACAYSLKNDADKAYESLKKAVVAGYADIDHMKEDTDFANVKDDPRFEEMIAWMENGGKEPTVLKAEDFLGSWKIESGMRAGSKIESDKMSAIKITKETFTIPSPQGEFVMAYKMNMDAKPIEVDFEIKKGPMPEGKAKGIIKMDDGKMTLCYHPKSEKRPDSFICTEENGYFRFKMKKAEMKKEEMKKEAMMSEMAKSLMGKWKCVKGTRAGADVDAARMASMITIDDKIIKIPVGPDMAFEMSYKIDDSKSPAEIDMKIEAGPAPAGSKALGIIKMKDGNCHLCYDPEGNSRPDKFESTEENGRFLFEMEKQK